MKIILNKVFELTLDDQYINFKFLKGKSIIENKEIKCLNNKYELTLDDFPVEEISISKATFTLSFDYEFN